MRYVQEKANGRPRSRRGETITEVLVALLISALGLVLLAGMIGVATRLITDSRTNTNAFIAAENALVAQSGSSKAGTIEFKLGGSTVILAEGAGAEIPVSFFTNGGEGGKTILSYKAD